jgi:arylsulfatase A-like enzyme
LFPLEKIQLPPGYREDDLLDLPPAGRKLGPNRYFAHIRAHDQWKRGIQGYLASIAFADAMIGRVVKALDDGPHRDNTIVVLWSDHGWHLGEKQHWQKYTAWRACTRIPLIIRVPPQATVVGSGTKPGSRCSKPVNLLSLYPTLLELAGLPAKPGNDGPSLVPLLRDASAPWKHVSLTHLGEPGSFGLSAQDWRLIHYANGDEELYHIAKDPFEWKNLAGETQHQDRLAGLRALAPTKFAERVAPSAESLPQLDWQPAAQKPAPPSRPDGEPFQVVFINETNQAVELNWISRDGVAKSYGRIESHRRRHQQTRPGAIWLIKDKDGRPLGHFQVGDRTARAVIPRDAID